MGALGQSIVPALLEERPLEKRSVGGLKVFRLVRLHAAVDHRLLGGVGDSGTVRA